MQEIPISEKIPELDIAIKAAKEAGNAILEIYHEDYTKHRQKMMIRLSQMLILRVMKSSKGFSHKQNMQFYLKKMMMI